jgi:hypothetical protein
VEPPEPPAPLDPSAPFIGYATEQLSHEPQKKSKKKVASYKVTAEYKLSPVTMEVLALYWDETHSLIEAGSSLLYHGGLTDEEKITREYLKLEMVKLAIIEEIVGNSHITWEEKQVYETQYCKLDYARNLTEHPPKIYITPEGMKPGISQSELPFKVKMDVQKLNIRMEAQTDTVYEGVANPFSSNIKVEYENAIFRVIDSMYRDKDQEQWESDMQYRADLFQFGASAVVGKIPRVGELLSYRMDMLHMSNQKIMADEQRNMDIDLHNGNLNTLYKYFEGTSGENRLFDAYTIGGIITERQTPDGTKIQRTITCFDNTELEIRARAFGTTGITLKEQLVADTPTVMTNEYVDWWHSGAGKTEYVTYRRQLQDIYFDYRKSDDNFTKIEFEGLTPAQIILLDKKLKGSTDPLNLNLGDTP